MARTVKHYELRGPTWKYKYPSGMIRRVQEGKKVWYERIDLAGNWIFDAEVARHFGGYSDGADEITAKFAAEVERYFTSGRAARDKKKGKWT
jgi:hypothetical protein